MFVNSKWSANWQPVPEPELALAMQYQQPHRSDEAVAMLADPRQLTGGPIPAGQPGARRRSATPASRRRLEPLTIACRVDDSVLEHGSAYFRIRSDEERQAAAAATSRTARAAHREMSDLHSLIAQAADHCRSRTETLAEYREALLDDALDDTFPASDPPAFVMPREREWLH